MNNQRDGLPRGIRNHKSGKLIVDITVRSERLTKTFHTLEEALAGRNELKQQLYIKHKKEFIMSAVINLNNRMEKKNIGYRLTPVTEQLQEVTEQIIDVAAPATNPPATVATTVPPAKAHTLTFPVTGQNVRTVVLEGKVWFVAKDVALVLGYRDLDKAIREHCKHVKTLKPAEMEGLTSSPRGINIIPESDVYRLVMRSKLPTAEAFQDWVVEEVLPSLRQNGGYMMMTRPDESPTGHPAQLDASAIIAHLDARLDAIQADIAPLQDKARRFHQFLDTEGSYNLTQAAKHFDMTAVELGELLRDRHHQWLFRKNGHTGHNTPTQYVISKGYMELKSVKNSQTGFVAAQARFTPKGLDALYDLLGKIGRV